MNATIKRLLVQAGPFLGLLVVIGLFSIPAETREFFLTYHNLKIVLTQTVIVAIGALGMTLIIVGGGIDLSAGSSIAFTSVVGASGNPGQANYAASKAGMIGFTKSIAKELGSRNVRCNAVAPGFIETEMTGALDEKVIEQWRNSIPLKRGGSPEDVANLTLFLASDLSTYITGQCINVCGGMLT